PGVAHAINNPVTTILGPTHLLLTHPETTSHVRDRLGMVAEEAGRAARIVQNLLLFARHYTPERRPCSIADQARRVLELKGYQLQQDNVRVVTDFASCPFVWADENQLQVVLLNLVQNAHQAMAKHPSQRVLTVRVWPSDRHACVEVRDTGPGIPDDALPRIFDPFLTTGCAGVGAPVPGAPAHHRENGFANVDASYQPAGGWTRFMFFIICIVAATFAPRTANFPSIASDLPAILDNRGVATVTWVGH